jgi:hypothetical protein
MSSRTGVRKMPGVTLRERQAAWPDSARGTGNAGYTPGAVACAAARNHSKASRIARIAASAVLVRVGLTNSGQLESFTATNSAAGSM